tara:strand:- start:962 stop:1138 length:177 start_codon:yes stop_codon:yes gene_type:complete
MNNEDKITEAAQQAKADQLAAMAAARTSLEAFWAGSASASVARHVRRGAVRTLKAGAV